MVLEAYSVCRRPGPGSGRFVVPKRATMPRWQWISREKKGASSERRVILRSFSTFSLLPGAWCHDTTIGPCAGRQTRHQETVVRSAGTLGSGPSNVAPCSTPERKLARATHPGPARYTCGTPPTGPPELKPFNIQTTVHEVGPKPWASRSSRNFWKFLGTAADFWEKGGGWGVVGVELLNRPMTYAFLHLVSTSFNRFVVCGDALLILHAPLSINTPNLPEEDPAKQHVCVGPEAVPLMVCRLR